MRYRDPKLCDLLAAEYVLGTLRGRARRRFEGLLHARPDLRNQVRDWELRLNKLAGYAAPVAPPAEAWQGLEQRLFPAEPVATESGFRWYQRLGFWRGLSAGSSALAATLAVLLLVPGQRPAKPDYVVLIQDDARKPMWMASASTDMGRLHVHNMVPMDMPQNMQCLLWLKPEGSQQYYYLGTLPDKGDDMMLEVQEDMRSMLPGDLLVSVEDMSGPMPAKPVNPIKYHSKWMPLTKI